MVPLAFQRILGVAAVAAVVMLDAAQSIPAPPGRSLDTTEMYYLANDSDDATSSYKPLAKKARTSSGAASPKAQPVHRPSLDLNKLPSTRSLDTTELYYGAHVPFEDGATSAHPPATHRKEEPVRGLPTAHTQRIHDPVKGKAVALSSSSSSESARKRKHASQVSSSRSSEQGSARSTSSSSASTFWQTSQESRGGHSEHVQVGSKGQLGPQHATPAQRNPQHTTPGQLTHQHSTPFTPTSPTEHIRNLGHESEDIVRKYEVHGIIQAKVKAIQEHAPHYPGRPEEYPYVHRGKTAGQNKKLLVTRRASAYNRKTRETYDRMALNQSDRRPLLHGVVIPDAVDRPAGETQQTHPQPPPHAHLADYRRFLSTEAMKNPRKIQRSEKRIAASASRPGVLPHDPAVASPGNDFRAGWREMRIRRKEKTDERIAKMLADIRKQVPAFPALEEYKLQTKVPVVGGTQGLQNIRRSRYNVEVRRQHRKLLGKGPAMPSVQSKGTKSHRR